MFLTQNTKGANHREKIDKLDFIKMDGRGGVRYE